MDECQNCGTAIEQPPVGRRRKWCSESCRKSAGTTGAVAAAGDPISPAVEELLDRLEFGADDPRLIAGLLLRRLAEGLDADGYNVALAREVRQLLAFISAVEIAGPGEIDTRRVEFLRDRILSGARR